MDVEEKFRDCKGSIEYYPCFRHRFYSSGLKKKGVFRRGKTRRAVKSTDMSTARLVLPIPKWLAADGSRSQRDRLSSGLEFFDLIMKVARRNYS